MAPTTEPPSLPPGTADAVASVCDCDGTGWCAACAAVGREAAAYTDLDDAVLSGWEGRAITPSEPEPPSADPDALPADILAVLDPGPFLAAVLEDTPPQGLAAAYLVEVVAAYKRLEAWAAAGAARAAAELARHPAMEGEVPGKRGARWVNVAPEELAMRLGVTRGEGQQLIDVGRHAFGDGALGALGPALETGSLDYRKTTKIVRTLSVHPDQVANDVLEEVLEEAPCETVHQVSRRLTKALVSVDPEEADQRHRRAKRLRTVTRPTPEPDGMADMRSHLPAADAVVVDLVLDAAAHAAKQAGDGRTVDQLRADALVAMAQAALDQGFIGPCEHGATTPATAPPGDVGDTGARGPDGGVTTATASTDGAATTPPAPRQRRYSLTGVQSRHTDVRITIPATMLLDPSTTGSADSGHAGRAEGEAAAGKPPTDRPAAGMTDPPYLDGYGPVNPEQAWRIAAQGLMRRLVTDPRTGAVVDVGRTRYRPPAELARFVRLRDRTCVRPGCTVPAAHSELDHTVPWSLGGGTDAANLNPLCRRDHEAKTAGVFQLVQESPGVFLWRSAAGLYYRRDTDGTVTRLPRSTVFRPGADEDTDAGPAPF